MMESSVFPVGIIGLGPLGLGFAKLLMRSGLPVIGYRRSGMDEFVEAGGSAAESPADLVRKSNVVLDCLPHEEALLTLFEGPFSIMDAVKPNQVVASLAGHSLEGKQRLHDLVTEKGGHVLDCVVGGNMKMAAECQATIYVSGEVSASNKMSAIFHKISKSHVHIGAFGAATNMSLSFQDR